MLRGENWALSRSSGSHTIIMEFIPNTLVGQVNFSSTTEDNCQRYSCTHVITTRQQYKKNGLPLGFSPGNDLAPVFWCILQSPGNFSLVGQLRSSPSYQSKPFTIFWQLHNPGNIRTSKYRLAAPPTIMGHPAIKNDTENIINAHVLPNWLINDTINQSLYRGVDAHLHLEALSSL